LAQTFSFGALTEKQQRDMEKLVEENKRLREEVEKLRAYVTWLQNRTNQAGAGSAAPRVVHAPVSNQSATPGAAPSNPTNLSRPPVTPAATARTHIVKAGENPNVIARKYGVKVDALMAANPRLDARRLKPGQALTIPAP